MSGTTKTLTLRTRTPAQATADLYKKLNQTTEEEGFLEAIQDCLNDGANIYDFYTNPNNYSKNDLVQLAAFRGHWGALDLLINRPVKGERPLNLHRVEHFNQQICYNLAYCIARGYTANNNTWLDFAINHQLRFDESLCVNRGSENTKVTTTPLKRLSEIEGGYQATLKVITHGTGINKGSLNHRLIFQALSFANQDKLIIDLLLMPKKEADLPAASIEGFAKMMTKEEALVAIRRALKHDYGLSYKNKAIAVLTAVRTEWKDNTSPTSARNPGPLLAGDFFCRQRGWTACSPDRKGSALKALFDIEIDPTEAELTQTEVPTLPAPSAPPATTSLAVKALQETPVLPNDAMVRMGAAAVPSKH